MGIYPDILEGRSCRLNRRYVCEEYSVEAVVEAVVDAIVECWEAG
jgi:hypothetical protein